MVGWQRLNFRRSFRGTALLLATILLAACQAPSHPEDPAQAFPYKVSTETKSMTVELTKPAPGLTQFVNDYLNRGKGAFLVNVTSAGQGSASAAGLRSSEVIVRHQVGAPNNAMAALSYSANVVVLPECGDYSTPSSFNFGNKRHPNHGCATRRNLGLAVADPGDLVRAQPMSDRPAPHSLQIINIYGNLAGGPTGVRGIGDNSLRVPAGGATPAGTTTAAPTGGGG